MQDFRGLAPLSVALLISACGAREPLEEPAPPAPISWSVAPAADAPVVPGDPAMRAIELAGLGGDLVLVREASFVEHAHGLATLEAVLASRGSPGQRWRLGLAFVGLFAPERPCRVTRGQDGALLGYPEAWDSGICEGWDGRGYALASGELTGLDDCQGARIRLLGEYPAMRLDEDPEARGMALAAACRLSFEVQAQPLHGPRLTTAEQRGVLRFSLTGAGPHAISTARAPQSADLVARADRSRAGL